MLKQRIKELSVRRRTFGETALDRVHAKEIEKMLISVQQIKNNLLTNYSSDLDEDLEDLDELEMLLLLRYYDVKYTTPGSYDPLPRLTNRHLTIAALSTLNVDIPVTFRFRNADQLHRVFIGYQFPAQFTSTYRHSFQGEEVFLAGLYRLHHVNVFGDIGWQHLFGWDQPRASRAFALFIDFMYRNWFYLVNDNLQFWKPYLPHMAEAIRNKLASLGDLHHSAYANNGFCVFGFIDNTNLRVCRPGGGPTADGPNAPRNSPLLQRSAYNGWKKFHGYKFQTIHLPNGMTFHVWGACSLRHNDLYTYYESNINELIAELQADQTLQYSIYGDSAYAILSESHLAYRYTEATTAAQQLTNNCMSSCRESIEWSYGDCMTHWKMLDFPHGLKVRQMDVESMFVCAVLLNNTHITLNGSNTVEYFDCAPPSFDQWVSQGPRMFV